MIFKNLFRIVKSHKLSLVTIIFFELLYIIKGYKGNRFNFSNNEYMTDNLPTPYYFLIKIKKVLKNNNFSSFLDLGCGSGRVINFFDKTFDNKNFIGIEYFPKQYEHCKKIFQKNKNIKIIQGDFTKLEISKHNADCYFLNGPFKKKEEFLNFIEKIKKSSLNKKILFVFINCNRKVIENLENMQCIENFYINEAKGYSVYSLKST